MNVTFLYIPLMTVLRERKFSVDKTPFHVFIELHCSVLIDGPAVLRVGLKQLEGLQTYVSMLNCCLQEETSYYRSAWGLA